MCRTTYLVILVEMVALLDSRIWLLPLACAVMSLYFLRPDPELPQTKATGVKLLADLDQILARFDSEKQANLGDG